MVLPMFLDRRLVFPIQTFLLEIHEIRTFMCPRVYSSWMSVGAHYVVVLDAPLLIPMPERINEGGLWRINESATTTSHVLVCVKNYPFQKLRPVQNACSRGIALMISKMHELVIKHSFDYPTWTNKLLSMLQQSIYHNYLHQKLHGDPASHR